MSGETGKNCGFVAVIGAPNAGKSTLINTLVGSKVSIVSPKVQTTRTIVRGVALQDNSQIIFVDTPGIFKPKKRLERAMVAAAWEGEADADIVCLIVDISRKNVAEDIEDILKTLEPRANKKKIILALNKIDKINPRDLLELSKTLNEKFSFAATFMISALKEKGTQDLLNWLAGHLQQGPWLYPEDQVSDMPMQLLAAEITREKLFHRLHQELPYSLTVETENWEQFDNGDIKIDQIIFVSSEKHKPIVLGKGGALIKQVGQSSRLELQDILQTPVHLKLFVKVREKWTDDAERYRLWGLDHKA